MGRELGRRTIALASLATALAGTAGAASAGETASTPRAPRARPAPAVDAILPGFEVLSDGSTRVFLQLSRATTFETRPAKGVVTVVIKDAHVVRRNNENPLVTVAFNTPVSSARLVPHGRDLWLVVALRSPVQPTVAMDGAKDGAVLHLDFPKGDYLPRGAASHAPSPSADLAGGDEASAPALDR